MTFNKGELPSEVARKRKEDLEKNRVEAEAQANKLRGAMRRVFSTGDGQVVLQWLHDECLHNKPILGVMNGHIDEKATVYQAMRLNLYLKIRSFLTVEILKEVEYVSEQIT